MGNVRRSQYSMQHQQQITTPIYSNKISTPINNDRFITSEAGQHFEQQQQQQLMYLSPINSNFNNNQLPNNQQQLDFTAFSPQPPNLHNESVVFTNQPNQAKRLNNYSDRFKPNAIDLMKERNLIDWHTSEFNRSLIPRPQFPQEFHTNVNCSSDIIRSTLTCVPESQVILDKLQLPFGLLIHPFKDLMQPDSETHKYLTIENMNRIPRCNRCRAYINPYVQFVDNLKWRCNLCSIINILPIDYLKDPHTGKSIQLHLKAELIAPSVEYLASIDYISRAPPPMTYVYLLDVSYHAVNLGYLDTFCDTMLENLDNLPGDKRTMVCFIAYSNVVNFFSMSESYIKPKMFTYAQFPVDENDPPELPVDADLLLLNVNENREVLKRFIVDLKKIFDPNREDAEGDSALGAAVLMAYELIKQTGGQITIMQAGLANFGVGSLKQPLNDSIEKDSMNLQPQTTFYKKLAIDCAHSHVCINLFAFGSVHMDMATISCLSKYTGGEIRYYDQFHSKLNPTDVERFKHDFRHYLCRQVGLEGLMTLRCTRGLSIHTYHGNMFLKKADLLSLPNLSPDLAFGCEVSIDEPLVDITTVCFQTAILYTSSISGERRLRVHTYCLPVSQNYNELINGADQEALMGLLCKMAADKALNQSLKSSRDWLLDVVKKYLKAFGQTMVSGTVDQLYNRPLLSPYSLRMLPSFIVALMKSIGFKYSNVKLDERVYYLNLLQTMPLVHLLPFIYPNVYEIHDLNQQDEQIDGQVYCPRRVHASMSRSVKSNGLYLLDCGNKLFIYATKNLDARILISVFNISSQDQQQLISNSELPVLNNNLSRRIRAFVDYLKFKRRAFGISLSIILGESVAQQQFSERMVEDRCESSLSVDEFLRYTIDQINHSTHHHNK